MNISETVFCVVDTETTGLDPTSDKIVEIATVATNFARAVAMWASLVNPEVEIPAETSAIHHLTDESVLDAPTWQSARMTFYDFVIGFGLGTPLVAHNAAFDMGFVDGRDTGWICTKRLARKLWPGLPSYKNQALRYLRKLKVDDFGIMPHRALGDALVTAALFREIINSQEFAATRINTVDDLVKFSASPITYTEWPHGKYKGMPLGVDLSYAQWAIKNMTNDPDLTHSLGRLLSPGKDALQ